MSMLSPYRVLDLTDHRGEVAGMMLADLGADVIKVEPPGGCSGRKQGPMAPAASGLAENERSLQFAAFNRNKRSIVLDPASADDAEVLATLVGSVDFVLVSGPDGLARSFELDFARACSLNARVVFVALTPYGSDGPASERVASDLTLAAMGGSVALQGAPERAPVRVTVPQVWRHAGAEAAAAALIAHTRMRGTGEAQFVDLSAQCSATWTTMNAMNAHAIQGHDFQRNGSVVNMGVIEIDPVFPCADGHLVAMPVPAVLEPLLAYLLGEEIVDASWLEEDWTTYAERVAAEEPVSVTREQLRAALAEYFLNHTKAELFALGLELDVTLAPVNTVADLLEFPQLEAREAWVDLKIGDATVRAPGVFARSDIEPLAPGSAAPGVNQHGDEIRAELGAARPAPAATNATATAEQPFAGLKVLDLTWVIAGPASVRYLSDHGARVIKVESQLRPDGLRMLGPMTPSDSLELNWNRSQFYGEFNAGKENIQLNLKHPQALDMLKQLIAWADIMIENWAPGATERLGIHYEANKALNPDLIMISTSLMGQTGPASSVAGYGYHAGGMAGFYEVTGWPDLPPLGPWLAYTDVIAPHFIATLATAALDHRERTGRGQHIDASQFEMALHFLAPEIVDVQLSGYAATRLGNRATDAAPHGVYPCSGDDEWCAIAVDSDEQWQALVAALGSPEWAQDAALATVTGRLAAHDAIDAGIGEWTSGQTKFAVMAALTEVGVPAGAVQRSSDLAQDPQYQHRGFQRFQDHAEMGRVPYAGTQWLIPGYQAGPHGPAPLMGEHNFSVMQGLLGMSEAEVAAAIEAGAVV